MKTRLFKTRNRLCLALPTEFATAIADKIDALDSCNVTKIRNQFKTGISKIIISDSKASAREDIVKILSDYSK